MKIKIENKNRNIFLLTQYVDIQSVTVDYNTILNTKIDNKLILIEV